MVQKRFTMYEINPVLATAGELQVYQVCGKLRQIASVRGEYGSSLERKYVRSRKTGMQKACFK